MCNGVRVLGQPHMAQFRYDGGARVRDQFGHAARHGGGVAVILLAGEEPDADALILKRSLALKRRSERTGRSCPVIAEVQDPENGAAVRRSGDVEVVEPAQLVTRVILQAARQPGLSLVYDQLLSFAGAELYFHADPSLVGNTYAEAAMRMPRAAVVGIAPGDGSTPVLVPESARILGPGDELVVVAEDDSDIVGALDTPLAVSLDGLRPAPDLKSRVESYLVLGWHEWAPVLLRELDEHMTDDADEEALKGVEAFEHAGLCADEHRKAQFGMPVGTTNTYALEGMEDMSPDEYMQAMLDKQMEERRQRRESSGGEVRAPLDSYFAQFNK